MYPAHALGAGKIHSGYTSLVQWLATQETVCLDGYVGICWNTVQECLSAALKSLGVAVNWQYPVLKSAATIQNMVAPYLGQPGDVWGTKCKLPLQQFFETPQTQPAGGLQLIIGTGAALLHPTAPVVYFDIPKNELQYRMRAGAVTNLGNDVPEQAGEMYKRCYFVDWPVLDIHKQSILARIAIFADTQWGNHVSWAFQPDLLQGIDHIAASTFRVRPWFEAGAWGGQWMKEHIGDLPKEEVNYAWSFEMIVPENGVVFESDGQVLELPFEWLMYHAHQAILGKHAHIFGYEFPIRFDFLDTFDGGNLSIQCHPRFDYIRQHFGETFTQDETYYILDCKPEAAVYLGFQQGVAQEALRGVLEASQESGQPVAIEQYVQKHSAKKHDLFLIPNGTVHSAGKDNLVLEISATPYIFTFKMYDWVRLGLDGKPRPISIPEAFDNLDFTRQGSRVQEELISKQSVIATGSDWQLLQLSTHPDHFYAVQRFEFETVVDIPTHNTCLIMMLVEGERITVQTGGSETVYHYAETFVIPAAAGHCRVINKGARPAKLVSACLKESHYIFDRLLSM